VPQATDLLDIPLDRLIPDPDNPRGELRKIDELAASIQANGILEPLRVRPADKAEHYYIVFGHRRHAAATKIALTFAPCLLVEETDARARAGQRLVENLQRDDLTPAETAKGIQQLLDLEMDEKAIVAETGLAPKIVKDAVTLAGSKVARGLAERHEMTMDQALVFAEFDDDKDALKELNQILAKDPFRWDHTVSYLRKDREAQRAIDKVTAELKEKGVRILKERPGYGDAKVVNISQLRKSKDVKEGTRLNARTHAKCPGHAAIVTSDWEGVRAIYYCTDVPKHGHVGLYGTSRAQKPKQAELPPKEREKASAERRIVIAGNKAWAAAEPVRIKYVEALAKRTTPPKGTLRYAVEAVLSGSTGGSPWNRPKPPKMTDKQLPLGLFKHVADYEETLLSSQSWRKGNRSDHAVAYLRFLESTGYALSLVEQVLVGDADDQALIESPKE
jgi:ParB family transcriptional regulator, chromosome partitioning protein